MSVSRSSRLEDIDNKRPVHRVQNWIRAYGWVHQTFTTETKTGPSRYRWIRVVTWQLACRWTQAIPSDTKYWKSNFVQIRRFLTKLSALFARSALQIWNFKTDILSLFLDGRHHDLRTPVIDGGQNSSSIVTKYPTSPLDGISCTFRLTRPSMKSTNTIKVKLQDVSKKNARS